ncbi:SRPBCC family protein [Mangrovimonas cancribranchiae]|uniref:SRPBCC family protein n=1 Tax=Mangrovimonas cancribranchiae TaxID=3080055 RepID=A0AAU6P3S9_9FLAO
MKYQVEVVVACPIDEFIKKFDNMSNMKHWQRGLTSYEFLSGNPGEVGSKTKLIYTMGKRQMVLIETITKKQLPNEFHATYDTKGMHNVQENFFKETEDGQTKWVSKSEFIPTKFTYRLMTLLMPGAFKKQSKQYMMDFKRFVEKGISVTEN